MKNLKVKTDLLFPFVFVGLVIALVAFLLIKNNKKITLENYTHDEEKRINNPQVGLVSSATDVQTGSKTELENEPAIKLY